MKKAILFLSIAAAAMCLKADVMYWQVGNTSAYAGPWDAARVGFNYNGVFQGYLYLTPASDPDFTTKDTSVLGALYVSGERGDGAYAFLPSEGGTYDSGNFNTTSYDNTAYTYFIELATYDSTSGNYTAVAQSAPKTWAETGVTAINPTQLSELINTNQLQARLWTGGSYTAVPEPTSSLMLLVGLSMLALRRRRG